MNVSYAIALPLWDATFTYSAALQRTLFQDRLRYIIARNMIRWAGSVDGMMPTERVPKQSEEAIWRSSLTKHVRCMSCSTCIFTTGININQYQSNAMIQQIPSANMPRNGTIGSYRSGETAPLVAPVRVALDEATLAGSNYPPLLPRVESYHFPQDFLFLLSH